MHKRVILLASAMAFAGSAMAAPVAPFAAVAFRSGGAIVLPDDYGLILVQNRGRGGGGGQRRRWWAASRWRREPRWQSQQQQLPLGRG